MSFSPSAQELHTIVIKEMGGGRMGAEAACKMVEDEFRAREISEEEREMILREIRLQIRDTLAA